MPFLNLGILAHVDAGKTSLTERLLYDAGVIDELGSVDAGSTRTDSMALERRRGITIRTAVTSFDIGDLSVNLIDTPGHPDFIAEVERALAVLDGAVLVLSAVEGVQSQSIALWRALRRLDVPVLVFINKIDRAGAEPDRVLAEMRRRLDPDAVAFTGSALTGEGVPQLAQALTTHLPHADENPDAEPAGVVFKIERDERGRQVYVRMRSGRIAVRDRIAFAGRPAERITGLRLSARGGLVTARSAIGGQIAVLAGVGAARIGDTFGPQRESGEYHFAPAMAETIVEPMRAEQRGALFSALTELQEQDPLIALRSDDAERDIIVSLYGEVQKEVLGALLAEDHGVVASFRETTIVCVERVIGTGTGLEQIKIGDNPYLATIGLRVSPGTGFGFELEAERGSMPAAFFTATEDGVRSALRQGLHGWQVEDCMVTMTHSGYYPRQSHAHQSFNKSFSSVAADFRNLAPVVLMAALRQAGTRVCEPIDRFDLEIPTDTVGAVLAIVVRAGGLLHSTEQRAAGYTRVIGTIPLTHRRDVAGRLADLTRGEGVLIAEPDGHAPVHGAPPRRTRRGPDPLNRAEWFRANPR